MEPKEELEILEYLRENPEKPPQRRQWLGPVNHKYQLLTYLSGGNGQERAETILKKITGYLDAALNLQNAGPSGHIAAGRFSAIPTLPEDVARDAGLRYIPHEFVFHEDDKRRLDEYIAGRWAELRQAMSYSSGSGGVFPGEPLGKWADSLMRRRSSRLKGEKPFRFIA
ncbi:MAG: hypothetical protein KGJ06_00590 [Pseudomonadota bacterium]|nr:hypothetical protein [Pseudomonadota bacterium]